MMNETTTVTNEFILEAAFAVHNEIKNNDGYFGYDASVEAFTMLHEQVKAIIEQLIHPDACDIDNVIATFFEVDEKIGNGELEVDWYL